MLKKIITSLIEIYRNSLQTNQPEITLNKRKLFILDVINHINQITCNFDDVNEFAINSLALDDVAITSMFSRTLEHNRIHDFCSVYENELSSSEPFMLMAYPSLKNLETSLDISKFSRIQLHKAFLTFQFQYNMLLISIYGNKYILRKNENTKVLFDSRHITEVMLETRAWINTDYQFDKQKIFIFNEILVYIYLKYVHCSLSGKIFSVSKDEIRRFIEDDTNYKVTFESGITDSETNNKCIITYLYVNRFCLENLKLLEKCVFAIKNKYKNYNWIINVSHINKFKIKNIQEFPNQLRLYTDELHDSDDIKNIVDYFLNRFEYIKLSKSTVNHEIYFNEQVNVTLFDDMITDFYVSLIKTALQRVNYLDYAVFNYEFISQVVSTISSYSVKPLPKQNDTFVTYISKVAIYLSNTLRTLSTDAAFISNVRNSISSNSEVVSHNDLQNILLEFITSCFKENMQYSVLNFTMLYYDTISYILSDKMKYLEQINSYMITTYFSSIFTSNVLSTYTYYMSDVNASDLFSIPSRLKIDYQVFSYNCYKIICGIISSIPYILKCQNLFWKIHTKIDTKYLDTDFYIIPDNKCLTLESSVLVTPDLENYYYVEGVNTQYIPIDPLFVYIRSLLTKMSQKAVMPMVKTGFNIDISNDIFAKQLKNQNPKFKDYVDFLNLLSTKYNYRLKFSRLSTVMLLPSWISTINYLMSADDLNQLQQKRYTYIKVNYQLLNKLVTSTSFGELANTLKDFTRLVEPDELSNEYEIVDTEVKEVFEDVNTEVLVDLSYSISESYQLEELIFSLAEEKYLAQQENLNPIENLIAFESNLPCLLVLGLIDENLEYHQDEQGNIIINEDSASTVKLFEYSLIDDQTAVNIINQQLGTNFSISDVGSAIAYLSSFMSDLNNDANVKENIIQTSLVQSGVIYDVIDDLKTNYLNGIVSTEQVGEIYQLYLPAPTSEDVDTLIATLSQKVTNGEFNNEQQISLIENISDTIITSTSNNIDQSKQLSFIGNVEKLYSSSIPFESKSFSNDISLIIESINLPEEIKEEIVKNIISLIPEDELLDTKETLTEEEIIRNDLDKISKPLITQQENKNKFYMQDTTTTIMNRKNGLVEAYYSSSKSSSIYEKGLFSGLSSKLSKPTGLEKSFNKLSSKFGDKINGIYNFSTKTVSNITNILFNNPLIRGTKSAIGLISSIQSGITKLINLPNVLKGMFKARLKDFLRDLNDITSFMKKLGNLFKKFSPSSKKENPSTKIARYDIEFDTPEMKIVEPTIDKNCIFGFVEPPLVLFDGMENLQKDVNAIVYTNEVFLTLKPGTIKKVDNAPFFVFQLSKFQETTKLVKDIMKRLGFQLDGSCSSVDKDGFVFMLSNYTIQHSHSNDASVSFINRFASVLTDVNRQWSVLFNKTKPIYEFTNKAINGTESVGESIGSSKLGQMVGNIVDFITPDKLQDMMKNIGSELWSQFKNVMPGMIAGATFDSPRIVTGSSSNISIDCDILLTCDLPIPEMIKERIIKPYMLLHVLSTPLTMYDYLVLNNVIPQNANNECYSNLKYLYMMPVYLKATLQYGYKGLSEPTNKSMYGLSPRKFYTVDCIITSINARDFVFRDGYIVAVKVSFTLTPVYNVMYGSTNKQDQSSMLTLGWLAKNFQDAINTDIYDSLTAEGFTTLEKLESIRKSAEAEEQKLKQNANK